jgi:CRP-like cAMP-binding protein
MASVWDLASTPLLEALSESDLNDIAPWFDVRTADEGVRLCGEGAHGYSFFILKSGTAEVTAQGQTLTTLSAGDFFGEMAILGDGRRSATVTTTSPATLLVMFGTEFRQLQQARPDIAAHIEDVVRQRVERG